MPLSIRFEHTRYPHLGSHSGYVQLVRHLDPRNYHAVVHAASDSNADLPRWLVPFRPLLRRLVRRGRMPWYKLSDLGAELNALPGSLAGRFDIVHFLDGEHSGQFLPRLTRMLGLSRPRFVATFHQPPEELPDLIDAGLLRWIDRIVLVSPTQLPFFAQHAPEERLCVLLHGVDAEFFHPSPAPNATNRIRCVTVGRWLRDWDTFKGVARACAATGDITFDVVTGRDVVDLGDLPNVARHSAIDDARLAALYRSADVLLLPLLGATANNALLEGMASGLAVVATDLDAVRAYLPNGGGILVENRVDAFVNALERLRQDAARRHELGRQARARAVELAWPGIIEQYGRLYTEVAAESGRLQRAKHERRPGGRLL